MFAPTACTTPTRLPTLMWSLAVALLLLSVFAPACAMDTHDHDEALMLRVLEAERPGIGSGSWRLLPPHQMMRAALLRRAGAAPSRMMPLAVLPSRRSALWLGLSASRTAGAGIELRWTVPLDGNPPNLRDLFYE